MKTLVRPVGFILGLNIFFTGLSALAATTPPQIQIIFRDGAKLTVESSKTPAAGLQATLVDAKKITKSIVRSEIIKLYPANESGLIQKFPNVRPEPFVTDEAMIVTSTAINFVTSKGVMVTVDALRGRNIEAWTGGLITTPFGQFFIASLEFGDGVQTTWAIRKTDGAVDIADDKFHALQSEEGMILTSDQSRLYFKGSPNESINLKDFEKNPGLVTGWSDEGLPLFNRGRNANLVSLREVIAKKKVMTEELAAEVIGQANLVEEMSEGYAHSFMEAPKKPYVWAITGPSGVGKSLIGETFAVRAFGDGKYFFKIEGSEYAAHLGALEHLKLLGSDKTDGALNTFLKSTNGQGVILIDEGDKINPEVWTRLMGLLGNNSITDAKGNTIPFKKLFVIITSNRGAKSTFPAAMANWSDEEIQKYVAGFSEEDIKGLYLDSQGANDKNMLPREIINRIDKWLMAGPLSKNTAIGIAAISGRQIKKLAREEYEVLLDIDGEVLKNLALTGFKSTDDARQINRAVKFYLKKLLLEAAEKWNVEAYSNISISLTHDDKGAPFFDVRYKDQKFLVRAPQETIDNPLRDPVIVARLNNLEANLKKRIIGQEALLKSVVESVTAHFGNAFKKRPLSMFFIGSTGTGKTETARAIAESMYGSVDRVALLAMGEVQDEGDFNRIVGAPPGYEGADIMRDFERALKNNPNGGVIVFDEASNMGGASKDKKNVLFKRLYHMVEEGKWTSGVNGHEYDLSIYTFIFTGNDGEGLFQGVSADDMKLAIYKKESTRARVRKLMVDAGIPPAFVGRMADIILMKPLLSYEVNGIVGKMFDEIVSDFIRQNEGVQVVLENRDAFLAQMAKSFFSGDKGGRSIRDIFEQRLRSYLITSILKSRVDTNDMHGVIFKVGLEDNQKAKPYALPNAKSREVKMSVHVLKNEKELYANKWDVTEFASPRSAMSVKQAKATAFHEAGHAVVNDPTFTGEILTFITLYGGTTKDLTYLGYARYEQVENNHENADYDKTIARIAQLYAGRKAQEMAGFQKDAGWSNDLLKIRHLATDYLTTWGLDDQFVGVKVNADGEVDLSPAKMALFDKAIDDLVHEGERVAEAYLSENWGFVRTLAAELLNRGYVRGDRFALMQQQFNARALSKGKFWSHRDFMKQHEERLKKAETRAEERAAKSGLTKALPACGRLMQLIAEGRRF